MAAPASVDPALRTRDPGRREPSALSPSDTTESSAQHPRRKLRIHLAVLAYFRRRRDLVDRTLRLHPGEVLVGDRDHIAALTDGTAVVGGVQRRWSTVGLYQVRAGQVAACWLLTLDPDSFDDVWAGSG